MDKKKYIEKRYELLIKNFNVHKKEISLHTYSLEQAKLLLKALDSIGLNWISFGDLTNFDMIEEYYNKDVIFDEENKKEIFRLTIDLYSAEDCNRCVKRTSYDFLAKGLDELLGNLDFKATMTKLKNIRKELKNE